MVLLKYTLKWKSRESFKLILLGQHLLGQYRSTLQMSMDVKIFDKILANQIQQYI